MKNALALVFLFLTGIILYSLTLRGIAGNIQVSTIKNNLDQATKPFELSPERGRFLLTMSLAEDKSFALKKELADVAYPDTGYYKGKYYIYFAPGVSLLALPFYQLGKQYNLSQVASYFAIALISTLTLIVIYQIGKEIFGLSTWASILSSIIFAFGSTSWSYAITMYQ